jgi:hypothetical protein
MTKGTSFFLRNDESRVKQILNLPPKVDDHHHTSHVSFVIVLRLCTRLAGV